jgi:hypothetical protein
MMRARRFPVTIRRPATVPLVTVDDDVARCCGGTLTATAADMAWWQRHHVRDHHVAYLHGPAPGG